MSEVIQLTFPDGAVKEFPKGTSTDDVAASISPGLKMVQLKSLHQNMKMH